jgi:hypothetical protein
MSLDFTLYDVTVRLTEDLLGTVPKSKEVYAAYIAAKGREMIARQDKKTGNRLADGSPSTDANVTTALAEEVETIEEVEEKGWTGFHQDSEGPFLFNYAIKGFLCESARTLKERGGVKQLQDKVKRYLFVVPRRIRLSGIRPDPLERPLRGWTAQGPRVTLARSDVVPEGTEVSFRIKILDGGGLKLAILRDILEYGGCIGLGQWRTGGYGSFELVSIEEV